MDTSEYTVVSSTRSSTIDRGNLSNLLVGGFTGTQNICSVSRYGKEVEKVTAAGSQPSFVLPAKYCAAACSLHRRLLQWIHKTQAQA